MQGSLPEKGWTNQRIELLLQELSLMDSNNFPENVGAGEREGRVSSELVAQRHYRFIHGIGRSGDITEVQPKAAGSSIIAKLTTKMVLGLIQSTGVPAARSCIVLPVATGMAMLLTLLAIRQQRPQARYVLWPRVDQKSCFKCIVSAGFEPVVVENVLEGDELRTDLHAMEEQLHHLGPENVACILTTTSCFAPRGLDRVEGVALLCKTSGVPHVINNAYGIQSSKCMHAIQEAHRNGRVDAFVQSTDKNLLVPVGGAIVASSNESFIQAVAQTYPGRASMSPVLDTFITLLSLGSDGFGKLRTERKETFECLVKGLREVAEKHGERLLNTPTNTISIGVTLSSVEADWAEFGSMLFVKSISGTSHDEVTTFLQRLDKTLAKFRRKHAPIQPPCQLTRKIKATLFREPGIALLLQLQHLALRCHE
ncbi:hypothetical protein EMCRGX_G029652 [Ephydatia muelleri]